MPPKQRLSTKQPSSNSGTTMNDPSDKWASNFQNKLIDSLRPIFEQSITDLDNKLTALITDVKVDLIASTTFATEEAKKAHDLALKNEKSINDLKHEFDMMKHSLLQLTTQTSRIDKRVDTNECYSRQMNLIFTGFREEMHSCDLVVRNILKHMKINNYDVINFERCHFLQNKKQIIVKFRFLSDRDLIWRNRRYLANSPFYVSEDLPAQIQNEHRILYPIARVARSLPQFNRKVSLNANKLIINSKQYTCDNLCSLPSELQPGNLSQKVSDKVIVFGGSLSSHNMLSNFYSVNLKYNGQCYSSSEQAYQHVKALKFKDNVSASAILKTNSPYEQKNFGRNINGFNKQEWDTIRKDTMKAIVSAKFQQNGDLKNKLLATTNKILCEASKHDSFFGNGLSFYNENVLNVNSWNGSNVLGDILMSVRAEMS